MRVRGPGGTERLKRTWASLTGLDEVAFDENLEMSEDDEALRHLLKLTSGLDSMVLGEEQILGQIKSSIAEARKTRSSGRYLNTIFDKAIRIGTRIRGQHGDRQGGHLRRLDGGPARRGEHRRHEVKKDTAYRNGRGLDPRCKVAPAQGVRV